VKLCFKLTDEAIRRELQKGNEVAQQQEIDIDFSALSKEDRELILRHTFLYPDTQELAASKGGEYISDHRKKESCDYLDGRSLPEILDSFRKFDEDIIKAKEKAEKKEKAEAEKYRQIIEKIIADNTEVMFNCITMYPTSSETFRSRTEKNRRSQIIEQAEAEKYLRYAEADDVLRENFLCACEKRNTISNQIRTEYENRIAIEKEEEEKREKAGQQVLLDWARKNGSELLLARIEENLHWQKLAESEFFNSICPDGYEKIEVDDEGERTNPQLEEIKELRKMKKLAEKSNGEIAEPRLRWNIIQEKDEDGDCTGEEDKFATVDITLVAPTGTTKTVSKRF